MSPESQDGFNFLRFVNFLLTILVQCGHRTTKVLPMRKNRSLLPRNQGIGDADTICRKVAPAQGRVRARSEMPARFDNDKAALSRRPQADFEMEDGLWDILEGICETEGLSLDEFIISAQRNFPDRNDVSAVRSAIAAYLGGLSWRGPNSMEVFAHTLHEGHINQPTPIPEVASSAEGPSGDPAFTRLQLYSLKSGDGEGGATGSVPRARTLSD